MINRMSYKQIRFVTIYCTVAVSWNKYYCSLKYYKHFAQHYYRRKSSLYVFSALRVRFL